MRQAERLAQIPQIRRRVRAPRQGITAQKTPRTRRCPPQRGDQITQGRRFLEILPGRRRLHLLFQFLGHILAPTLEKFARLEDPRAVVGFADLRHARRRAIPDDVVVAMAVILFVRHARTARAQTVFAFENLERAPQRARVGVRTVIARPVVFLQPHQREFGKRILQVDLQLQEIFIIAERDVVFRPELLDQPPLEEHRFGVRPHHMHGEIPHRVEQRPRLQIRQPRSRRREILRQPLAQIPRFAHVDDAVQAVAHQINTRLVRHLMEARPQIRSLFDGRHTP